LFLGKEKRSDFESTFVNDEHFILRYPLKVGTVWEELTLTKLLLKTGQPQKTEFKIVAEVPLSVTIEAIDDVIKVPAGTFHQCIRIKKYGSAYKNTGNYIGLTIVKVIETSWYAPGVGLVKSIREETTLRKALDWGELLIELVTFSS